MIVLLLAGLPARGADHPLSLPPPLAEALETLRDGGFSQTLARSRDLAVEFPGHPLPFLLAAEAQYGLIFCETGHINSREIWNAADTKSSARDEDFRRAVESAEAASEAMRRDPGGGTTQDAAGDAGNAALGNFYLGLAHGVRARLSTLRAETLSSGREGKQMRAALQDAAAEDARLKADADAGIGLYNYYADVLSPLVKMFRFFLRIPGGDRDRGLRQLQGAARDAMLLAPEAQDELAKIYGLRENRPGESLALFGELADRYPRNAIYSFSASLQAERIGRKDVAVGYARKAADAARQMDEVCRARLEPAARQALERLQSAATLPPNDQH